MRSSLGGLVITGSATTVWWILEFSPLRTTPSFRLIGLLVGALLSYWLCMWILGFGYGLLVAALPIERYRQCGQTIVLDQLRTLVQLGTLRARWPAINTIIAIGYVILGIGGYMLALYWLPTQRAVLPPLFAMVRTPMAVLDFVWLELARISSVVTVLAGLIAVRGHSRDWWQESFFAVGLTMLRAGSRHIIREISMMTNKLGGTGGAATPSQRASWIRVGVFLQLFGLAFLFQAVTIKQGILVAGGSLGVGVLVQAIMVGLELRALNEETARHEWLWLAGIVVLPIVGGVGYILWRY